MDVDTVIYDASLACVQEQVGNDISAVLAGSASLAGQNWVDVGGKFAGATSGTSLISQFLSEALPQQLPVALPTFTNAGLKFTPILGRVIGRWVPIVGYFLLAYDYKNFADCVDSKIQVAAKSLIDRYSNP